LLTGGLQPAQDDPSEGTGKAPRSSWAARCLRQLHVHIRPLTQRDGEADLRCVVSLYSAGDARKASEQGLLRSVGQSVHLRSSIRAKPQSGVGGLHGLRVWSGCQFGELIWRCVLPTVWVSVDISSTRFGEHNETCNTSDAALRGFSYHRHEERRTRGARQWTSGGHVTFSWSRCSTRTP
jgi:hypothetical protein